jgi:hypothetical protein
VLGGIGIDLPFLIRFLFPGGLDQPIVANAMTTPADRARPAVAIEDLR